MRQLRALVLLLVMGAAAACDAILGGDDDGAEELSNRRRQWQALGIQSYDYVRVWNCFCVLGGVPLRISVRQGTVQSVTIVESGEPAPISTAPNGDRIEELFDILADAYDQNAVEVRVQYDAQFGFPAETFVNYRTNVIDEERGWRIESFEVR